MAVPGVASASPAGAGEGFDVPVPVDMASGKVEAVRLDPALTSPRNPDDVDAAWIERHLPWERDSTGRERLLPRRP
jgi:hypothetical protein